MTRGVWRQAREWLARWGWLAWGIVILVVSVVPIDWVFGFTPQTSWSLSGSVGHFVEFGLFAVLAAVAWGRQRPARNALAAAAAAAIGYGLLVEVIQWPIPYRSGDPVDFAVDVVGVVVALGLLVAYRRRREPDR